MQSKPFRVINPIATGANIVQLRKERRLSVRDLQTYFGFEAPRPFTSGSVGKAFPLLTTCTLLAPCWMCPWMRS